MLTAQEVERQRAEALCAVAPAMGYLKGKVLDDGSVCMLGELLFTRAIFMGVTEDGWRMRFCFEDRALASKRFDEISSEDDEPSGYVARRYG